MITIDRALEVVNKDGLESGEGTWEEYLEAIQLGAEALRQYDTCRGDGCKKAQDLLPGETRE